MENEVCCPKFDPSVWDDKVLEWNDKKFIKGNVKTFMYMPIGFGKEITRLQNLIASSGVINEEYLCLSIHPNKWNMNIYLAINKEIPSEDNISLNGNFYSKVYEGSFSKTGEWIKDFEIVTKEKGYNCNIQDLYMWYTTCPKCAKKYGKNYVVVIGKIK